ncbi:MAG: MMPL family transporter [Acidimicrobiales bacterium]
MYRSAKPDAATPKIEADVLRCAVVFGLSMDYEVILLSRVKECFDATGDARAAVVEGLASTGRIITSAALIMVTVFAAFGLARSVETKALGIGLAIAVALDATFVRAILVPATLAIVGRSAWWGPAGLQRRARRIGTSQAARQPTRDAAVEGDTMNYSEVQGPRTVNRIESEGQAALPLTSCRADGHAGHAESQVTTVERDRRRIRTTFRSCAKPAR